MVVLLEVQPRPRLMTTAIYKFVMETQVADLPADFWLRQPIQLLSSLMEVIATFSMSGIWDIIQERDHPLPQLTLNVLGKVKEWIHLFMEDKIPLETFLWNYSIMYITTVESYFPLDLWKDIFHEKYIFHEQNLWNLGFHRIFGKLFFFVMNMNW